MEDGILYGFVAKNESGSPEGMGACYQFDIVSGGKSDSTRTATRTTAKVQVTNSGTVFGTFDFLVPGGGFGQNTGCKNMDGWEIPDACFSNYDNKCGDTECTVYGGLCNTGSGTCEKVFSSDPDTQKSCRDILFNNDIFPAGDYTGYQGNAYIENLQPIDCPPQLVNKTGISGNSNYVPVEIKADLGDYDCNAAAPDKGSPCMTHYWDCCKMQVSDGGQDGYDSVYGVCSNGAATGQMC
jgi:hypothetical protein